MPWYATIVIAVRKNQNLSDLLEKNGFPKEDALIFEENMDDIKYLNLEIEDLLDEYNLLMGGHIMALTSGDFHDAEDIRDNFFTEYLFDKFYGLQTYREKIFNGDIIVLYMYG